MCMVDGTQCPSSVNLLDGDDVMVMTEAAFCTLHATPLERGPSWMVRPPARPHLTWMDTAMHDDCHDCLGSLLVRPSTHKLRMD